ICDAWEYSRRPGLSQEMGRKKNRRGAGPGGWRQILRHWGSSALPRMLNDRKDLIEYRRRCLTDAGRQRVRQQAVVGVIVAEQMPQLVLQDGEQIHVVPLTLVAGRGELDVVTRRRIEPAPAGGVDVAAAVRARRVGAGRRCRASDALLGGK